MNVHNEKDEYLEALWRMKEKGQYSMGSLESLVGDGFDRRIIDDLLSEGLVEVSENSRISLTKKGEMPARRIIRAHRLGERLIYDVLGGNFEAGACEFEHMIETGLLDSICILLGHPRECPHGMPIPEGECCRQKAKVAESSVIPLTDMESGEFARVAYVNGKNNQRTQRMGVLQIRPGSAIRVLQKYPCYVVDCEGGNVALGNEEVSSISVWKPDNVRQSYDQSSIQSSSAFVEKRGRGWGFKLGRRKGACRRQGGPI